MKIIVAVSRNWGIGKDNKLLFSLKEDMKFFKRMTTGKVVVMGGNTYASLPKRPLKDRVNIVLTRALLSDCICVSSLDDLFGIVEQFDSNDVFVIGGASMYRQLLPYCDTAYVTKVDGDADADTFFPNLDSDENWELVSQNKAEDVFNLTFCEYKNKKVTEYRL